MADVHAALTASKSNPQNFVLAEPSHPLDPVFHFFLRCLPPQADR